MSKDKKTMLVPKLRFPEFRDVGEWKLEPLDNCLDYLQPTKYLVKSTAYNDKYKTPVLTAGKTFILGYTDETEGIFSDNLPVIIFDDFTTASKFVAFPFKAKSSAMKILLSKKNHDIKFLYEAMQMIKYEVGVHERHWISIFSNLDIPLPQPKEQQRIADCLSSLDALISAQAQKVDALKTHKKGLMQQLFPAEGESIPKLRFPDFRDVGEWEEKPLRFACQMQAGKFLPASEIYEEASEELNPCFGGNGLRGFTKTYTHIGKYPLIGRQGEHCGNINLANGQFHATEHAVVATPLNKVDVVWLYYSLLNLKLNQYATGQAQPGLSVKVLKKITIKIPKNGKEQQKIADCLSSLDALIVAQVEKLDALKTHKKGLMQQLFPSTDGVQG